MVECKKCPAFIHAPESIATGLCHGCRSGPPEMTVETPKAETKPTGGEDYRDLLRRAIWDRVLVPSKRANRRAIWGVVADMLCIGSTRAARLCTELGFDPNMMVRKTP